MGSEKGRIPVRPELLVGRAVELGSFERLLDQVDGGRPGAVVLIGEPGIGKTRLLKELGTRADQRGQLVLQGSASELERDLPLSVFVDALDQYVAGLEPKSLGVLDDQVQTELGHVFPSLWALADGREVTLPHERFRSHRAVRTLLEHLAATRPLVLILDDFHWADPASVELLGALLRRPPAGAVAVALALRPLREPGHLPAALERAHRSGTLVRIEVGALTPVEASDLLSSSVGAAEASLLYEESGGNPFYLEQLARSLDRAGGFAPSSGLPADHIGVPSAVAASLNEELGLLSQDGRLVFEGAAVAGDPFEPELAAAAAATSEVATMDAIDELLRLDLVRTTDVPRRFRFRHPLVRRAAYEGTAAAWRVRAHERCAESLAARGATAAARAHHVERSARQGDVAAAASLREAGEAAARLAPESASRWFGAALRLLPPTAPAEDRVELMLARAKASAAAGHFATSHGALREAIAIVPERSSALAATVATACARLERFLGRYEQAHVRLVLALRGLPESPSVESVGLLIELALNEFYRSRYEAMHGWAERAVSAARVLGDVPLAAAALALPALAHGVTGATEAARSHRAGGEELTLIPGAWKVSCLELLTRCQLALDRPREAERAAGLAEELAAAVQLHLAAAWADRAAAAVALSSGDTSRAIERAIASAEAAQDVGAPIEAALSRTLAGRALAAANQIDQAVVLLQRAATELDACGALRYRDSAERQLGRLGHRPHRRTRPGKTRGPAIEGLTARELQVARLVVDRKTNPEIAAELFLSQKTVETHLSNIFNKMRVTTRVALARAVERSDRPAGVGPT
jgi:DNA-binding NarL/FixJ family response regulator